MEVSEVIRLADWMDKHTKDVNTKYAALVTALQNNAQQAAQTPVSEPLKDLSRALSEMPTQELSTLQMRVLDTLDVKNLVGKIGRHWLNKAVRSTTYDPATTYTTVEEAAQKILTALARLREYKTAAVHIGFIDSEIIDAPTPYLINVIFQGNAAIENVRDWKKTAADWELIISSVAGVVGEKPEEVKVVGTSNGSIIFTLSASPLVTKVLATISKHIASIANDYLDFQLKRQELERSRMMTKVISEDLSRQEQARRTEGQNSIMGAVKAIIPNAAPDDLVKLNKAVEKQISFSEKGGEVDFVSPPNLEDDQENTDLTETFDEIRGLIEEYRAEKQQTALLTYQDEEDEEED